MAETIAEGEPWPLEKIRADLATRGAQYIDDADRVAKQLPLQIFTNLFGSIRIHEGHMLAPSENVVGGDPLAGQWHFTMDVKDTHATYEIYVEPFNGRLVGINRIDRAER